MFFAKTWFCFEKKVMFLYYNVGRSNSTKSFRDCLICLLKDVLCLDCDGCLSCSSFELYCCLMVFVVFLVV